MTLPKTALVPLRRIDSRRRSWLFGFEDAAAGIAALFLILLVLASVLAPLIAPHDPNASSLSDANLPPWAGNLLGTDASGRDIFSRVLFGAQSTLLGPLIIVLIATVLGVLLALLGAWFGGRTDEVVSRVFDGIMVLPGLLLALVATAVFGAGVVPTAVALSIAYIPYIGRLTRSALLNEVRRPYIAALRLNGFSALPIWIRHLLPNIGGVIIAQMTVNFGYALVDMAAISFLGLGVQPPQADWGVMVAQGQSALLRGFPMESLSAGIAILLTVLAFNTVGDRLERRFHV